MGEVGMLPGNPEADLAYLSSNDRNLPSKLQLSYKTAAMVAQSQCRLSGGDVTTKKCLWPTVMAKKNYLI